MRTNLVITKSVCYNDLMIYIHPADRRYGPRVGGYRYKKWTPPEPLSITILKMIGLGIAFTAASILSPTFLLNAIKAYLKYKYDETKYYDYINKRRIQASLRYLKRKHFIAYPGKGRFSITKKGASRLNRINIDELKIKKVPWDGKWRLLTFDIPEEKEQKRDYFRKRLKEMGFYHFQRSVFILPYPCKKEIDTICEVLDIESNVHLITGERFEGDDELVKLFHVTVRSEP